MIFPHNQMNILAYNRVLKDLNGKTPEEILAALGRVFEITENGAPVPAGQTPARFLSGRQVAWAGFQAGIHQRPAPPSTCWMFPCCKREILAPLFDIQDPRTSKRIAFVGGIRGTAELEKLVDSGEFACAFSMFPTGIEDLMDIADAGGIMPPKSTWFEPKLRDAMFSHLL